MTDPELPEDAAPPFVWHLEAIHLSGGERIPVAPTSVTILIGPNSSGKSATLRNIRQLLNADGSSRVAVQDVTVHREGTFETMRQWFARTYPAHKVAGRLNYFTTGGAVQDADLEGRWSQGDRMPGLGVFLAHLLDTAQRLSVSQYVAAIPIYENAPQAYIHVLQADEELHRRVSAVVRDAFGLDLVINWVAGSQVGFHVGQEPAKAAGEDRVSAGYAAAVQGLPRLDAEGDGLRSFVGALLAAFCGPHPVLMIDEPEAFLHPPQAYRLGLEISKTTSSSQRQVLLATHSADVVRGALDSGAVVSVVRITRDGAANHAAQLDQTRLAELWSRPLLRSSAAITGLFHRGVVVCEADGDVRFYNGLARRQRVTQAARIPPDLYFVHGGGKGALSALTAAYRSLDTPVAVVADLDLLKDLSQTRQVVEALGGDWVIFETPCRQLATSLAGRPPLTPATEFVANARTVITAIETAGRVSPESKRALNTLMEDAQSWSEAKRYGVEKLRGGEQAAARTVLDSLSAIGLFLVPVGELEGWWTAGPASDKAAWMAAASELLPDESQFGDAEAFIKQVVEFLQPPPASGDGGSPA